MGAASFLLGIVFQSLGIVGRALGVAESKWATFAKWYQPENRRQKDFHSFERMSSLSAVLVAIAIPVFTAQLKKSKAATDEANGRSLYAEINADFLAAGGDAAKITLPEGFTSGTAKSVTSETVIYGGDDFTFSDVAGDLKITVGNNVKVEITSNSNTYTFGK